MSVRFLLAVVLAARCAAAAERPPAAPPQPPAGMTPCQVVTNKRFWKLAKIAFGMIVTVKKSDIEGALPGRFFPGTLPEALLHPGKDGHFLAIKCGAAKVPCSGVRDLLEERFAESTLAQSVSREPENHLFDAKTWELTAEGKTVVEDAKRCRPGIWSELAPFLTGGGAWN